MTPIGTIPTSDALAEASLNSLQDLMARDPESYQPATSRPSYSERSESSGQDLRRQRLLVLSRGQFEVAKPTAPINPTDFGISATMFGLAGFLAGFIKEYQDGNRQAN